MTKLLLIILFFTLPLVHGRIFPTLGLDIYFNVSGNFELTKSLFFNVFSGIIFLSFFVEKIVLKVFSSSNPSPLRGASFGKGSKNKVVSSKTAAPFSSGRERIQDRVLMGFTLLILTLSTLFSLSPFMSFIGDLEKGHTALLFFNLLGLFILLKNQGKSFLKKLMFTSLLAGVFAALLSIKELYFPTYDYGALGNRALGSFGHPNYLAGYLLLLLPFTYSLSYFPKGKIQMGIKIIGVLIILLGILLSKSVVAIVLALGYIITLSGILSLFKGKRLQYFTLGFCFIIGITLIIKYFPEKLHSFLSRFYLWETTLKIIFSNIKIFLIGGGAETLPYYFDSFKVPEVYIYENFGFTADRPHNFILNIFYHFGVFALGLFLYGVYYFAKYFKNSPENIALLLFLLFGIIHYFSISSYILVLLIIVSYNSIQASFSKGSSPKEGRIQASERIIIASITLLSLIGAYYSLKLYQSEILYNKKQYIKASENFPHPKYLRKLGDYNSAEILENIISGTNYKSQISSLPDKKSLCEDLTQDYPSAENNIYCGNIFWELGHQDLAKEYYNSGLSKLPDLWNEESQYWDNYFIKNTITGNRFFSEKFGDINGVLEKLGK